MINAVFWTVAAAALAAAACKARGLRRPDPPPGLGATCLLLVMVGLALALISPGAQEVENAVYPNSGRLLSNLCTMVAAFGILAHLLSLTCRPEEARVRIRRWLVTLLAAVSLMIGLFVATPLPPVIGDFGALYRDRPTLVGYILIFALFLGWALTELAMITVRYATPAARPALRSGLRIVTVGCVLGIVYLVEKTVVVIAQWLGLDSPVPGHDRPCPSPLHPPGCAFSVGLPVLTALAITVGMTLPSWGPALAAPVRWSRHRRTYRQLEPLWRALAEAIPQIVLPRGGTDRFNYHYGVYRRVIEIHDGLLVLRPFRDADVRDQAEANGCGAGLDVQQRAALLEAIAIRAALTAYQARERQSAEEHRDSTAPTERPIGSQTTAINNADDTLDGQRGGDLNSEADWLMRVSSAFAGSSTSAKETPWSRVALRGCP